jgi:predicted DNA-binding ribbon-helix-helix protein
MNSSNTKRSIVRNGQKTSVSLEQEFWEALREIAATRKTKLTTLVQQIDEGRGEGNLSSAIRVYVFRHLRAQLADGLHAFNGNGVHKPAAAALAL